MKTKTKKIILKRVKENLGSAWEKGYQNFDELNEEEEDLLGIVEFAMNEARQEGIEEIEERLPNEKEIIGYRRPDGHPFGCYGYNQALREIKQLIQNIIKRKKG